jgi:hypothetical protein
MKAPSHPLAEGLCYIVISILALMVIANASKAPHDPISPDGRFVEASR